MNNLTKMKSESSPYRPSSKMSVNSINFNNNANNPQNPLSRARKVTITESALNKFQKTLTVTKDVIDNFLVAETQTLKINSFSWNEPFESIVDLRSVFVFVFVCVCVCV